MWEATERRAVGGDVAILVPLLIVLGLPLLAWGIFRIMEDHLWDRIVGGVLVGASVLSLLAGAVGLLVTIRGA